MSNAFDRTFAKAHATLQQVAGDSATYTRGATNLNLTVVRARQNQRVEGEMGVTLIGNRQDFLVEMSDLATLSPARPERGDRITVGGDIWELQPDTGGGDSWLFTCPLQTVARVHTVRRAA